MPELQKSNICICENADAWRLRELMSSDGYRELLSLGIILAAVVFFSNYVLSYAQELPAKTDNISDITSEIAIPTATSSVQQQTPQEQFITPGLSSRGDQDNNSIRNSPLEPETQEKASDLTMRQPDIIQQKKQKGTFTEQQIDNQEVSKDIVSDKKRQLDKIMEDSLTESKSTLQAEDSGKKQQDKYSDDDNTDNTDSEDQEEIQQDERVNDDEEEENNNHQNNNDKDDNNNDNIPLELPIPFP
jgi:hypothetical protein